MSWKVKMKQKDKVCQVETKVQEERSLRRHRVENQNGNNLANI